MVTDCRIRDDAYVVAKIGNQHGPTDDTKTHRNQSKSKLQEMLPNDIAMSNYPIHK